MKYCVVFITAPRGPEPKRLAKMLLNKKLCACVNIVNSLDSFFWWKSKIDSAREALLILKTKRSLLERLIKEVKAIHSYSVCEIVALPLVGGNPDYFKWIQESC
jgi:periplasmic divalent cation tolerance protein